MPINWRLRRRGGLHPRHSARERSCATKGSAPLADGHDRETSSSPREGVRGRSAHPGLAATGRAPPRDAGAAATDAVAGDDVHRLMYTSGTAGRPKGVIIAHPTWRVEEHRPSRGVRLHARRPRARVRAALSRRARWISRPPRSSPRAPPRSSVACSARVAVVDEIERSARHHGVARGRDGGPRSWPCPISSQRDLSSVRVIINGGEKMPIPLYRAHSAHISVGMVHRHVRPHRKVPATPSRPRQPRDQARQRRPPVLVSRSRPVGRARPFVTGGRTRRDLVRGPKVFKGYWPRPQRHRGRVRGQVVPHRRHRRTR